MKTRLLFFLTILLGISLTTGCIDRNTQWERVNISLHNAHFPLSFYCSRFTERRSCLADLLIPSGCGAFIEEIPFLFEGEGKLDLPFSRDQGGNFKLYISQSYYPITVDILWRFDGNEYSKTITLDYGDYPVVRNGRFDDEEALYSYEFFLLPGGDLKVRKSLNITSSGVEKSRSMKEIKMQKNK